MCMQIPEASRNASHTGFTDATFTPKVTANKYDNYLSKKI